jgi:tetrahydromethanopterin S-methyltransferase subunit G
MWKRQIHKYLDDLDKIKENKIIITPSSFSLVQDNRETIEKWTEFKKAEINDTYILLLTSTNYMIPKNSMTSDEFDSFKKVISEKIKNEL